MTYQPLTTNAAPYTAIVRIEFADTDDAAYQASGVLIAPNIVLTAGHVVDAAMVDSVFVTPDQLGAVTPFGRHAAMDLAWLAGAPLAGLIDRQQSGRDLGLIALATPVDAGAGAMALQAGFTGGAVRTAGYPALDAGDLETESLRVSFDPGTATLQFPAGSALPGSSGSPLWATDDGIPRVVGIVSTGSWAAQLTHADLAFIADFEAAHPVPTMAAPTTAAIATIAVAPGVAALAESAKTLAGLLAGGHALPLDAGVTKLRLTDGVIEFGAASDAALVTRLYTALLGRTPDAAGMAAFDGAMQTGMTGEQVAATLLASREYAATHAASSPAGFVDALYASLLGRAASAADRAGWAWATAHGDRAAIAAALAGSAEAMAHAGPGAIWVDDPQATLIDDLYQLALDRQPGTAETAGWIGAMQAGLSPTDLARDLTRAPEYAALHAGQGNDALIAACYQNGLNRPADTAGAAHWSDQLQHGGTAATLLLGMARSAEMNPDPAKLV